MSALSLSDLGFSRRLIEHLRDFDPDSPLGYRCQPPQYYRSSPLSQRNIVALWECGTTVTYFNCDTIRFEQCSLEDVDTPHFSLSTIQALLADLFIDLYEDDCPDEELRETAASIGFLHVERLLSTADASSREGYGAWRSRFLSSCGG